MILTADLDPRPYLLVGGALLIPPRRDRISRRIADGGSLPALLDCSGE
jgi:hypothetical protein